MRSLVFVVMGLVVMATVPMTVSLAGGQPHSVTGSGIVVQDDGVAFRSDVGAVKQANGRTSGTTVTDLDLSAVVPELGTVRFKSDVTCLAVDGNSAWVGGNITTTSNPDVAPLGTPIIIFVKDVGGNGEDIQYGAFVDGDECAVGTTCEDEPFLPQLHVVSGNYTVR